MLQRCPNCERTQQGHDPRGSLRIRFNWPEYKNNVSAAAARPRGTEPGTVKQRRLNTNNSQEDGAGLMKMSVDCSLSWRLVVSSFALCMGLLACTRQSD
ncbi:uncharacterized protein METZ01_LOCUS199688, partial [marine metagenome]